MKLGVDVIRNQAALIYFTNLYWLKSRKLKVTKLTDYWYFLNHFYCKIPIYRLFIQRKLVNHIWIFNLKCL